MTRRLAAVLAAGLAAACGPPQPGAGSISKQFLAALVVRLAEQGLLAIDDPVTRHLPAVAGKPITGSASRS